MSRFTIYRDNYVDSTVVSNRFIDEYMKDANDAQLKIYLYLIRMMSANLATSVSEIADKFNHTEKDVMRALKYWEKHQLLSLDYDESKSLVGIHLQELSAAPVSPAAAASESAPVISIVSRQPAEEFAAPVQEPFAKPSYSLDQLRDFCGKEDTKQLFTIAEIYLGKTLTPSDMKSILYFSDCLKFSNDLIDYLLQYCVERGKKSFRYIEAVAINWAKEGISTPKQAEKFSSKYDESVYVIMKELGRNSSPTAKEAEYINRWTKEYGFTLDVIREACERTVLATDKHRFEYADSILTSWKKENVHGKSDIRKIDELYQKRRTTKNTTGSSSNNKFNQFPQHDYDFEAIERELLSN
ncbi:MAG: DnaD domain protein [Lachnospiraceae bacterium]|nr:DnaD domain protein [Lachnospiraceae bacterium]